MDRRTASGPCSPPAPHQASSALCMTLKKTVAKARTSDWQFRSHLWHRTDTELPVMSSDPCRTSQPVPVCGTPASTHRSPTRHLLSLNLTVPDLAGTDSQNLSRGSPLTCYAALRVRPLCGRQHYDNDNSQCKPRDFGWKLRGARRNSRE
jgi:hypothetical protein